MKRCAFALLFLLAGLSTPAGASDACCQSARCNPEVDCTPKVCQRVETAETEEVERWCCRFVDVCLPRRPLFGRLGLFHSKKAACSDCGTCDEAGSCRSARCEGPCGKLVRKKHLLLIVERRKVPVSKCLPAPEECAPCKQAAPAPPLAPEQAPPAPPSESVHTEARRGLLRWVSFFRGWGLRASR